MGIKDKSIETIKKVHRKYNEEDVLKDDELESMAEESSEGVEEIDNDDPTLSSFNDDPGQSFDEGDFERETTASDEKHETVIDIEKDVEFDFVKALDAYYSNYDIAVANLQKKNNDENIDKPKTKDLSSKVGDGEILIGSKNDSKDKKQFKEESMGKEEKKDKKPGELDEKEKGEVQDVSIEILKGIKSLLQKLEELETQMDGTKKEEKKKEDKKDDKKQEEEEGEKGDEDDDKNNKKQKEERKTMRESRLKRRVRSLTGRRLLRESRRVKSKRRITPRFSRERENIRTERESFGYKLEKLDRKIRFVDMKLKKLNEAIARQESRNPAFTSRSKRRSEGRFSSRRPIARKRLHESLTSLRKEDKDLNSRGSERKFSSKKPILQRKRLRENLDLLNKDRKFLTGKSKVRGTRTARRLEENTESSGIPPLAKKWASLN